MASLKDQLMQAGLANAKRARQADHAKRQAAKGRHEDVPAAELANAKRAEQLLRDQAANKAQQEAQAEKAVGAQIRQLIEMHQIDRSGGDQPYQFADGTKVRKLWLRPAQLDQVARGQIAIVRVGALSSTEFALVPTAIAEKIAQRDSARVVLKVQRQAQVVVDDDPYADYPIPDDLMW
ncbi:MAG: DUF2058 domain-containing protein [Paraperlucidibaca sp.]